MSLVVWLAHEKMCADHSSSSAVSLGLGFALFMPFNERYSTLVIESFPRSCKATTTALGEVSLGMRPRYSIVAALLAVAACAFANCHLPPNSASILSAWLCAAAASAAEMINVVGLLFIFFGREIGPLSEAQLALESLLPARGS